MPYARLSVMSPREQHREELQRLHVDLLESFKSMPGYLGGYLIVAEDASGNVGRFTLWETQEDADRTSQDDHVLAVRSEMRALSDDGDDGLGLDAIVEQGFDATPI